MNTVKRIFLMTAVLPCILFLTGCHAVILHPEGIVASDEKQILITSVLLMLIVVVPVIVMSFYFAWRYRALNQRATYAPDWSHNTWLEIICWSVPCLIIIALGTLTWTSSHRLDPYRPIMVPGHKPLVIQAISLEWKWLFIYPEQHIATINYVEIPAGVPVEFLISAEGPMNSFQIPALAGQIYAMAGMQTKLHLVANKIGDYSGMSASFSGDGFSDMNFITHVTTANRFAAWIRQVKKSPYQLTTTEYNKLIEPSIKTPIKFYSSAPATLFNSVVMKSMGPSMIISQGK